MALSIFVSSLWGAFGRWRRLIIVMYNGSCAECYVGVRGRGVRGHGGSSAGWRGAGSCRHTHGTHSFPAAFCPAAAVCKLPGVSIIKTLIFFGTSNIFIVCLFFCWKLLNVVLNYRVDLIIADTNIWKYAINIIIGTTSITKFNTSLISVITYFVNYIWI